MAGSPAYQFYARDFDAATASWSNEEVGAYIRLLNYQWENDCIPEDVRGVASILRTTPAIAKRLWWIVEEKFIRGEGGRQNRRMENVRRGHESWSDKSRRGGQRSARVREARRMGGTHTDEEWSALVVAVGGLCPKCGQPKPLTKDHVIPLYQGGSDRIENIQPLCRECNSAKGPDTTDYIAHLRKRLKHRSNQRLNHPSTTVETNPASTDPTKGQHSGLRLRSPDSTDTPTPTPSPGGKGVRGRRTKRLREALGPAFANGAGPKSGPGSPMGDLSAQAIAALAAGDDAEARRIVADVLGWPWPLRADDRRRLEDFAKGTTAA